MSSSALDTYVSLYNTSQRFFVNEEFMSVSNSTLTKVSL